MIEPRDQFVERGARLGLLDAALQFTDAGRNHRAVDILDRLGHVGEHGEPLRRHFGKAAEHDDFLRAARAVHGQNTRPQRGDERRVVGQHAEIALGAGHVHLLDVAGEQQLFRRDQIEMESRHY